MNKKNNIQKNERDNVFEKKRLIVFILIVALVLIIPVIATLNFPTPEQSFVSSFVDAIISEDVDNLKSWIVFEDGAVTKDNLSPVESTSDKSVPSDLSIRGFLKFVKKDPMYENLFREAMERKINYHNRQKNIQSNENQFDNMFKIKKKIKDGKFYDHYIVEVKKYTININTNVKEGRIVFDNNKIISFDNGENTKIGPLIAGEYTVKVIYNGQYAEGLISEKSIDINSFKNDDLVDVIITLDYKMINIDSEQKDAKVFINQKETEFSVENAKNIGPITSGAKIHLEKRIIEVGLLKSKEISVGENTNIFIKFPILQQLYNDEPLSGIEMFNDKFIDYYLKTTFKGEYLTMRNIMKSNEKINFIDNVNKFYVKGNAKVSGKSNYGIIGLIDNGTIYGAFNVNVPYVIHYYTNDKNKQEEIPDEYMREWVNSLNNGFIEYMHNPPKKAKKDEISGIYERENGTKLIGVRYINENEVQFEARIQNESYSGVIKGQFKIEGESYGCFESFSLTTPDSGSLKFAFYKGNLKIIDENTLGLNKNYFSGSYIKRPKE